MCKELRGRVKLRVWLQSEGSDESDGRSARRDFKIHCREEEDGAIASADLLDELMELGDEPFDSEDAAAA
jgi:hypothetical protein